MSLRKMALIVVVALVAGFAGYLTYASHQRRVQHKAIAAVVAEATVQLKDALSDKPGAEPLKNIDAALAALRATPASRQVAFAGAAEGYLVSARAIVLRRSDVLRLTPTVLEREQELAAHMSGPRGRDDGWIRRATELKRLSDQAHYEFALASRTLGDMLESLPEAEDRLAPHVDKSLLLEEPLREATLKQARLEQKRATDAQAVQHQMLVPR